MIVCHCNVLTKAAILEAIGKNPLSMPQSPVQVHKCMGCAPQCGRCLTTVRALLEEARITTFAVGCAVCPSQGGCAHNDDQQHHDHIRPALPMVIRAPAVAI
jgi:bacterioferritin-associated ferredoxin